MATQKIVTCWSRIEAWLQKNWPEALVKIRPGAAETEIDTTERLLAVTLPEEVRCFYQLHDGTDDVGLFPSFDRWDAMAFSPLPLTEVRSEWKSWKTLDESGEFADQTSEPAAGIRADWWNRGWLPIASNGGGDSQCIDLAPAAGGRAGQVISMWHEHGKRECLASSFTDYLQRIAEGLGSGKYRYEKGYGIVADR
jgi:cell wall assembly regulator SMI1